ncbi:GH92 family glycosyl hydrolase [Fulvivirgaceae bacterium BMA12]|uniref:GH92 family glycosyl hydrolase n=1 Tax=Agaribacillus aureus TaxID=3051825 RepID=A0ABT8L8A5_9BACT|nr:GH92 family glycosyl hydrolase [Fulvivirgaceae bacterium BMA12]
MRNIYIIGCCSLLQLILSCTGVKEQPALEDDSLVQYVDPFIGTGAHGHTFPGATVPFGMVQLSPDNGTGGWDWCSGYHYSDSIIVGFSHTHLSGTGIGDLADVLVMPTTKRVDLTKAIGNRDDYDFKSHFDHESEEASPGYYSVHLKDVAIDVALTATKRAGFHRYSYPQGEPQQVVLDLSYSVNWDKPVATALKFENDTLITGFRYSEGWAKDQRVYFAMAFSRPIIGYETADSTSMQPATTEFTGGKLKTLLHFENDGDRILLLKTGLSSASVDGAVKSLNEIPGWDFGAIKAKAESQWEQELSKIRITSNDTALKRTFYTAMYHSNLAPVIFSDHNQEYKGVNGKVMKADGYQRYDIFSLWDTYRAAHPLFTILQPDRVGDMVNSMLAHYQEYGLLPVWSLLGNETNTMTGYHAIPVIADAYLKGFQGFDIQLAYEAMKTSAMQNIRGVQFYKEHDFIPADLEVESVTKTLEYAFDDWCIAQIAKSLNYQDDYNYFLKRSQSFRHLFDSVSGFMRGKLSNGQWRVPFDPKRSDHRVNTDYTEGNAWQHTWYVPQDVPGLIDIMGGRERFIAKLDSLFTISSDITGENVSVDISGLIGQYAHGNEPSHHVAYLYNYADAAWKTQERVTEILSSQYNDRPDGLCGNDDCGQMSAWYIFSSLGFYPVNPAESKYAIGRPLHEKSVIRLSEGKTFTVTAENLSENNIYVQSATLNDIPLNEPFLTHDQIINGGKMVFVMGSSPNKNWNNSVNEDN